MTKFNIVLPVYKSQNKEGYRDFYQMVELTKEQLLWLKSQIEEKLNDK